MTASSWPAWLRVLVIAAVGFLYGWWTANLPAPHDPTQFWIGNVAAPYLLLPFLAGAWRFQAWWSAAGAGALAGSAMVAGFYNIVTSGFATNLELGLPLGTGTFERLRFIYARWFGNFVLGDPSGTPWLSIAIVVGVALGLLGFLWGRRGARWAGALVALAFVVEPIVYLTGADARVMGIRKTLTAWNMLL